MKWPCGSPRLAHALHGAIGVTAEYDLQLWTRRLHEWWLAHGSEAHRNTVVGRQELASSETVTSLADLASGLLPEFLWKTLNAHALLL